MASSNRKIIKKLYAKLAKRYTDHPECLDKSREVLEHLVYAAFLENASFEAANQCFSVLESYFVDWNEIRVSTARELGEVFASVYQPERTGERIRRILQYIFESLYKFDLEEFRARGPVEMLEYLQSIPYSTDFISSYTVNTVFKMQDIPLDEGSLRALRLLDLVEVNERNREYVEGLGNAFTQSERFEFFQCLHAFGLEMLDEARRPAAIELLKEIDSDVDQRSDIPLVDLSEITDPFLIAKQLSRKEHKPKMPIALAMDEETDSEIIDEVIEDGLLDPNEEIVEEEETYIEVRVESRLDSLDEDFDYPASDVERKKNRSAAKRDRADSDKESETSSRKKSGEKKSGATVIQEESAFSAPDESSKSSSLKARTSRGESSSKDEAESKKSDSKSSSSSDKKKSGSSDKKVKEDKAASATPSTSSAKSGSKESGAVHREKQPSGEKSSAKPAGKRSAGPVTQETTTGSGKKAAAPKKDGPAKAPAKSEKAVKAPARKEKTTPETDKAKKAPVKTDEAKKESAKKGGAKGDGAKKDGPKQDADKAKKPSATKKLQQKKPH
ncbi:MAG: hypothetical protein Q4G59_03735 [Planctomycetia bacterium]|nr:hypothetical protein [Planctomycetia bacterium]